MRGQMGYLNCINSSLSVSITIAIVYAPNIEEVRNDFTSFCIRN